MTKATVRIPVATYRLELSGQFRFEDVQALAPYLHDLGITDLYVSPVLQARRGSCHGYDVIDPTRLNAEIGSEEKLEALASELRRHDMGLLLDIVPNHMAASVENPWWMDVLENGPASTYATYFDIDWHPPNKTLENKVLLPILGRQYAQVLEDQELTLSIEEDGFFISYAGTKLPVAPKSYGRILEHRLEDLKRGIGLEDPAFRELSGILAAVRDLPERVALSSEVTGERRLQREAINERLWQLYSSSQGIRNFLDGNLRIFNGKRRKPASFVFLDELLTEQAYVLSFWRSPNEEINYRRFFTITDLVGVRVEDPLVFDATHTAILRLVEKGVVTGLRIDHIDGLRDPMGYLHRLEERLTLAGTEDRRTRFYVIVEKILSGCEPLPKNWSVCGTTGYDFLNVLNGLFVDARGYKALDSIYRRFIHTDTQYSSLVYEKKKHVMETLLAVEMRALGHHLSLLAEQDRYARDLPLGDLTQALIEATACLPVYRTYIRNFDVTPLERSYIEQAIEASRRRNPALNSACFDFLHDVLSLREKAYLSSGQREAWLGFVMRWQQFSGPIMAKGFEDTILYIYNPLVSVNEVGGGPHFSKVSVTAFHEFCRNRGKQWPHTLNATSTHDTKRSEDVRARINVLSELPSEWNRRLDLWARWNNSKKAVVSGRPVPDRNEEILLYQTMLGAWPFQELELPEFRKRLQIYMLKAIREAMVHTKWTRPNIKHEKALSCFIEAIFKKSKGNRFLHDFLQFQRKISYYGALNALAQVIIKVTAPGVPDFYQGSELWDLHLVDPDNRGPVDFEKRIQLLKELKREEEAHGLAFMENLLDHWEDGHLKLYLTSRILNFRKAHPQLFREGGYHCLEATGRRKENICAFLRHRGTTWVLTAAPRLVTRLACEGVPPLGKSVWGRTALILPDKAPHIWKNVLTQETLTTVFVKAHPVLPLANALGRFPVALLESEPA